VKWLINSVILKFRFYDEDAKINDFMLFNVVIGKRRERDSGHRRS
jgi:hypothetical protein